MKRFASVLATLFLSVAHLPAASAASSENEPYPLDYWALRSVISQVQISPDGKYLALLKIPSKDGNPVIEVYEAANLEKEPFRLNADPMEITSIYWASENDLVFNLRQQVRNIIEGFNEGVFETKIAVVDVEKRKIREFEEANPVIENLLHHKPGKIIISFQEGAEDGPGARVREAFRPRAYWEFDLDRGTKKLLIRGKLTLGNIDFDGEGNPWLARGYHPRTGDLVTYIRDNEKGEWEELYRQSEDDPQTFIVTAKDPTKPDHVLVVTHNGNDKEGLWSMSVETKELDELIYRRSDVDLWNVRYHSNEWEYPDTVVAISYFKDNFHFEYFDEIEGAIYNQLESVIPHAHYLAINSRSRDGNTMTIYNEGPRDPGTYYLLREGRIQSVGSKQPLLEGEKLADIEYITYESRDGRKIPGFLTVPDGEPPHPLIVVPHGGPFVAESVTYNERAQMFANNGYLVLQPQYRGSQNYGLDYYHAAFDGKGEIGYKMQDDKDDGAMYLVEQGLADPDRLFMYGGSYGGYASLVAASRTPQIYKCVIAAAVVSDPILQTNYLRFDLGDGWENEEFIETWDNALSPVDEAAKVNIPVLIIHGSVDQRTPPEQARRYMKQLDKYGKSYKFIELKNADHFTNTWTYEHKKTMYGAMIDFLQDDCGKASLQAQTSD